MKLISSVIGVVMSVVVVAGSPNKPFPQNEQYDGIGRPSVVTDIEMNEAITKFYERWKKRYIVEAMSTPDGFYLSTSGGTGSEENAVTVSEGHGYGMIILALMAGYDADAKSVFDGFFKVFKKYPSDVNPALMTWEILGEVGSHEEPTLSSSATDGDFDIAYALILADRQWGSDGEINYIQEAKRIIKGFAESNIHEKTKRVLLGDWVADDQKWAIGTRSSDWVPAHFQLFGEVSGDKAYWDEVNDTIFSILKQVQNPKTGLIPDFIDGIPAVPAPGGFLETDRDGAYSSNACRDPWRLGMAVSHGGYPEAREAMMTLLEWINKVTDGDLSVMDNGYTLEGVPSRKVDDWGTWGAYSAPMMVAATIDSSFQKLLDSGWEHNSKYNKKVGYYGNSLRLLSLLAVSGNWWKP